MTNAPRTRKTHVIRICGTNRAGDVLQDIWADVERIDVSKNLSSDDNYQGLERRYLWMDDPNADDYEPNGNPSRRTEIVKVCDPESNDDVSDPDEWIPIPRITSMKMHTSSGDNNYQGRMDRLKNDNDDLINGARVVENRRILHYDTNIDDAAQVAFDGDPSLNAFVVPGELYERDESTKDEAQYVEHEIPMYVMARGASASGATNMSPVDNQGKQFKLLNEYLIDESEPAKLDKTGQNDIDPPYRLDPFQYIINISFGGLAVEFFDGAS